MPSFMDRMKNLVGAGPPPEPETLPQQLLRQVDEATTLSWRQVVNRSSLHSLVLCNTASESERTQRPWKLPPAAESDWIRDHIWAGTAVQFHGEHEPRVQL